MKTRYLVWVKIYTNKWQVEFLLLQKAKDKDMVFISLNRA